MKVGKGGSDLCEGDCADDNSAAHKVAGDDVIDVVRVVAGEARHACDCAAHQPPGNPANSISGAQEPPYPWLSRWWSAGMHACQHALTLLLQIAINTDQHCTLRPQNGWHIKKAGQKRTSGEGKGGRGEASSVAKVAGHRGARDCADD